MLLGAPIETTSPSDAPETVTVTELTLFAAVLGKSKNDNEDKRLTAIKFGFCVKVNPFPTVVDVKTPVLDQDAKVLADVVFSDSSRNDVPVIEPLTLKK